MVLPDLFVISLRIITSIAKVSRCSSLSSRSDWKNEWQNFAIDSGCVKEFEKNALSKFLHEFLTRLTAKPSAVDALGSSRVQAVMSVLRDGEGPNLELRLEKALRVSEAGDEHTQSRDARTISIIYLAELPGEDWLEWYGAQRDGIDGLGGSADLSALGISQLPTIDVRKSERYVKVHKDTNCTSFQRALADKTGLQTVDLL